MIPGGWRDEMRRFASVTLSVCSFALLTGCVGSLSNPEDFIDGGTGERTAEVVLAESCGTSGCHDMERPPQHELDLLAPNVEQRVVGVNSIAPGCENDILVVAGEPDSSYLLDKILNSLGICGLQMPVVGLLPQSDIDIIEQWIIDLGGSGGGTPDGG